MISKIRFSFSHLFLRLSDKTECLNGKRMYRIKRISCKKKKEFKTNVYQSYLITKCILEVISKMEICN